MDKQEGLLKRILIVMIIMLVIIFFCACQPTPDQSAVNNKNNLDINIPNSISSDTKEPRYSEESHASNNIVIAQMEYGSNTLIVDAELCDPQTIKAPQVRVGLKDFKDGDTMKEFVESIYPDAKIYDDDGVRTSDEISSEIVYVKQLISIAKEILL